MSAQEMGHNSRRPGEALVPSRFALRCGLFLLGAAATYAIFIALAINNVTGIRGAPINKNPFELENQDRADFLVLGLVAVGVVAVTLVWKRAGLGRAFIAGQWAALLAGALVIILR